MRNKEHKNVCKSTKCMFSNKDYEEIEVLQFCVEYIVRQCIKVL